MTNRTFTRRQALQGGARWPARWRSGSCREPVRRRPEEQPALVVLWLNGGPAGLFNSAGPSPKRRVRRHAEQRPRPGGGLFVGRVARRPCRSRRAHMASVNFRHGVIRPHEAARAAVLEEGGRSRLLRLAAVLPAVSRRCAVVNDLGFPAGVNADPPAEDGIALERVVDSNAAARKVGASRWAEIRSAYGAPERSTIGDSASTFAAVEALIASGTGVVFAQPAYTGRADRQFDTHEDDSGAAARAVMAPITPLLSTFLARTLAMPGETS